MKTIIALSLLAAAFAFVPAAEATNCDPVTGAICEGSYGSGTCDNGYASNFVQYYSYDSSGYSYVSASSYCSGSAGSYAYSGIGASATVCDPSWNCDYAGAAWYGYDSSSFSYCDTTAYASVDGQSASESAGCPVGTPPGVPAVLP